MTTKYFLGIDPGLNGALAFYSPSDGDLKIWDMPTHSVKTTKGRKNKLDIFTLANILDDMAPLVARAIVEEVGAMPKQGVTSSFNFGFNAGCAQMVVAAFAIPLTLIRPAMWKRDMKITAEKADARRAATRLMPLHNGKWPLVKHDGRAEAALLAYYLADQHYIKGEEHV